MIPDVKVKETDVSIFIPLPSGKFNFNEWWFSYFRYERKMCKNCKNYFRDELMNYNSCSKNLIPRKRLHKKYKQYYDICLEYMDEKL